VNVRSIGTALLKPKEGLSGPPARKPRHLAKLREAHAQDGIKVGENHQANGLRMLTNLSGKRKHVLKRRSVLERPLTGALDDRPIGKRIAERHTQFNHARTRVNGCQNDLARGREVGVAAGYVSD